MTEPSQYFKGRTVQEQMDEVIGYVDVRSAEVAVNAIAGDVAQVHQDMLDADADASAAAASAAAAAGTLANAVKKTGEASQSIAGDIAVAGDLTGGTVTVPAPVNNTDAANKKYVDDADALAVPILNVNRYAVGLAGNQGPITGIKTFAATTEHTKPNTSTYIDKIVSKTNINQNPQSTTTDNLVQIMDTAGSDIFVRLVGISGGSGGVSLRLYLNNGKSGTMKTANLTLNITDGGDLVLTAQGATSTKTIVDTSQ